jgi:hypothetical protein
VTTDDVLADTNLVRDVLKISGISTESSFCMQPMFRVLPGFSTGRPIHGNDGTCCTAWLLSLYSVSFELNIYFFSSLKVLISNGGNDYVIGDDIRGISAVDLSELSDIQGSKQQIDNLVSDLSIRLSTLVYDTEFYTNYTSISTPYSEVPHIGCDNITTSPSSSAFVTGDILTIMGRSYLGGFFSDPLAQVPTTLDRLKDIEQVLMELHLGLYEIHLDLLKRGLANVTATQVGTDQAPLHSLDLGNDIIHSRGSDTVVGDCATLFFQVDRPGVSGFGFSGLTNNVHNSIKSSLSSITKNRDAAFDLVVENVLTPSEPIRGSDVAFWDVPYFITVGADSITVADANVTAVGDFATIGMTFTDTGTPNALPSDLYGESIHVLRYKPSVASFLYRLE